ncbi:MAG: chemotaxis protein CheX [Spirochaetales bacterium]|nr:chemotaxis protein CheX [Spirochaetales bacterium]
MQDGLLTSKILVYERDNQIMNTLKNFLKQNSLHGLRTNREENIVSLLKANIDLGCVILCEIDEHYLEIGRAIKEVRSELPIFLRVKKENIDVEIDPAYEACFDGIYCVEDIAVLKGLIEKFLFNRFYPADMVADIIEMTKTGLYSFFDDCTITCDTPYLVKDRMIYGEISTLISIESNWCRGFMMFETSEADLNSLINKKKNFNSNSNYDIVASVLGEITNLSWGAFRNKFIRTADNDESSTKVQVPIYVNHMKKYISFGSSDPHLCFRYRISDGSRRSVDLYHKLIFNLKWNPEEYEKENGELTKLFEPGDIELF